MKTLSYSLIVENMPTLTERLRGRLVSYYQGKGQIPSLAAATKTYAKIFRGTPPGIELNIKKGKVFIVLCSDWSCTLIGKSLIECVASFSSFHQDLTLQLGRHITFRFLEDQSLDDLIKKDRTQRILKVLGAFLLGILVSLGSLALVTLLLELVKKITELWILLQKILGG